MDNSYLKQLQKQFLDVIRNHTTLIMIVLIALLIILWSQFIVNLRNFSKGFIELLGADE